jgi:hypothetical protein
VVEEEATDLGDVVMVGRLRGTEEGRFMVDDDTAAVVLPRGDTAAAAANADVVVVVAPPVAATATMLEGTAIAIAASPPLILDVSRDLGRFFRRNESSSPSKDFRFQEGCRLRVKWGRADFIRVVTGELALFAVLALLWLRCRGLVLVGLLVGTSTYWR